MTNSLGKPAHDSTRWGAVWSNEAQPRELVRMADVVRRLVDDRTPLRVACAQLVEQLHTLQVSEYFLLRQGDRAARLSDADRWCPASAAPAEYANGPGWPIYQSAWHVIPAKSGWATFDPDERLTGSSGLQACLRSSWAEARTLEDLDADLAGQLAMLKEQADLIAPTPAPLALQVPVLRLVDAAAPSARTEWTADTLRARLNELKGQGIRAYMQRLSEESGLHARAIQRLLKEQEKAAQPLKLEVWAGHVFKHSMDKG